MIKFSNRRIILFTRLVSDPMAALRTVEWERDAFFEGRLLLAAFGTIGRLIDPPDLVDRLIIDVQDTLLTLRVYGAAERSTAACPAHDPGTCRGPQLINSSPGT
jgi:hypothetical protein